jgi:hypothetical protein
VTEGYDSDALLHSRNRGGACRHARGPGCAGELVPAGIPERYVGRRGDPANRVISADGPLLVRCAGGEELRRDSAGRLPGDERGAPLRARWTSRTPRAR